MKLFNVADKVIKGNPFYFLSKDSKLLDEASKLDFSFEVLDSEIGLRKIKFDVEHLATFLTYIMKYTSVLYCKDLKLLPELVGDKIKATKVEAIIKLESNVYRVNGIELTEVDYEILDLIVKGLQEVVLKLEYDIDLNSNIEERLKHRYFYKLESGLYLESDCDVYESLDDVTATKPLFDTIRTRYVDYSSNFYRFYHLLGDYKKKVELLVKLTKDKQKLDSLTKRG